MSLGAPCRSARHQLLSGATLTQTHTHNDLVNGMVRNHVLEKIITKSLWVRVWVSVAPLSCCKHPSVQGQTFIWGFDDNFTNYTFRRNKNLDCLEKPLPKGPNSMYVLENQVA